MLDDPAAARLAEILAAHEGLEGPLLPILHAVQAEWGHIPDWTVPAIARALNLGRAEVHGVVSFYHDFRDAPAGRHVVRLCAAEACQAQGGRALAAALCDRLGLGMGETAADGSVTLEPVYCLGLCAAGPAALVDGQPLARATPDAILETVRC
ncbi:formate dehydrogenase subunit gamma [Rubellimicrobium sp. CFH 75288]|uniref:formate dehydrogenase subunit gamma n=1 Tax=Rubellimicrobium sp. CFH 75288 TaxID=2697034 RepID=UPI001411F42B|nr:formate dehydrogenase subunit gamma [Rubellimicrobium sp. CFH 75288]NAZ38142.1 formate dehydrogenase subunit gamma [Rubellimicrobium sp. CFH 75288]